jgi:hypothetical protein
MGNRRLGAAITIIIGVLLVGVGVWAWAGGSVTAGSDGGDRPSATAPVDRADSGRDGPPNHDGPPNYKENRGPLLPRELTPQARQQLEKKATEIGPVLEQVRQRGTVSKAAVVEAIVGLGYPADSVYTEELWPTPEVSVVVFGISSEGGCVKGSVRVGEVRTSVDGFIPEWGCQDPKTH